MTEIEAKIYLSEQRGKTEFPLFRSFHTFNFGNYFDENKNPYGVIRVFNDNTLAAGKSMKMQVEKPTDVLILPLVGGIEFKNSTGYHDFLEVGKMQIFTAEAGMEYEVLNPYEAEENASQQNTARLINYLEIWIEKKVAVSPKTEQVSIDIEKRNELLPIYSTENTFAYFGKFGGREDNICQLKNGKNGVFAFVIEGAFEFQNRLLHPRDGLALWNVQEIDFEALSNDAMLLIFEMPA
jgi:quercetin 2,3-dioxygenase